MESFAFKGSSSSHDSLDPAASFSSGGHFLGDIFTVFVPGNHCLGEATNGLGFSAFEDLGLGELALGNSRDSLLSLGSSPSLGTSLFLLAG